MPALAGLEAQPILGHSHEGLAEAEAGGPGNLIGAEAIVEVPFYACAHVPSFHLISLDLYPKAGGKGGEAGIGIGVDIGHDGSGGGVDHIVHIVGYIGEEVFGKTYHLAGIEGIEITDESVYCYAGLALLRKSGKGKGRESHEGCYLFHNHMVRQKGISW